MCLCVCVCEREREREWCTSPVWRELIIGVFPEVTDIHLKQVLTGVKLLFGPKVLRVFCFDIGVPERRGGKGGDANFKTKHTELFD